MKVINPRFLAIVALWVDCKVCGSSALWVEGRRATLGREVVGVEGEIQVTLFLDFFAGPV